jgi:hypothetical protein
MTPKKAAGKPAKKTAKPAKKVAKSAPKKPKQLTAWQKFERMVAMIEHTFAPNAVVKSPDKVPDIVSGELRDVDATIRTMVGSVPTLVAIECRKRKSAQDVMWIEQLAAKRLNIGANAMIAVSEKGFSEPAIDMARRHNITLRTLEDVSNAGEIRKMFDGVEVQVELVNLNLQAVGIRLAGGHAVNWDELPIVTAERTVDRLIRGDILLDDAGQPLDVRSLLDRTETDDVSVDGPPVTKRLVITTAPDRVFVRTVDGLKPVEVLEFTVACAGELRTVVFGPVLKYGPPGEALLHTTQATLELGGDVRGTIQLSNRPDGPPLPGDVVVPAGTRMKLAPDGHGGWTSVAEEPAVQPANPGAALPPAENA